MYQIQEKQHMLFDIVVISVRPKHKPQAIWVHRTIQARSEDRWLVWELRLDKVNFQLYFWLKRTLFDDKGENKHQAISPKKSWPFFFFFLSSFIWNIILLIAFSLSVCNLFFFFNTWIQTHWKFACILVIRFTVLDFRLEFENARIDWAFVLPVRCLRCDTSHFLVCNKNNNVYNIHLKKLIEIATIQNKLTKYLKTNSNY